MTADRAAEDTQAATRAVIDPGRSPAEAADDTVELLQMIHASISVQEAQEVIDWIVGSPDAMHVLLEEFIVRIALGQILANERTAQGTSAQRRLVFDVLTRWEAL